MSRKASLELSVNMIVVMILSLILIGVGMFFLVKGQDAWEQGYKDLKAIHEKNIKDSMARSGQLVMVYPNSITVLRGEGYIFTLGINNEAGADQNFWVVATPTPPVNTNNKIIYSKGTAVKVMNNQPGFIPIKVMTDKQVGKVSYIFNVCVFNASSDPGAADCDAEGKYGDTQKIIVNVR